MRASELLGRSAVAADGRRLGEVVDVHLVEDGPGRLRVDGCVIGRRAAVTSLGLDQPGQGPAVLRRLSARRRGERRYARWADLTLAGDVVRVARTVDVPVLSATTGAAGSGRSRGGV